MQSVEITMILAQFKPSSTAVYRYFRPPLERQDFKKSSIWPELYKAREG
jgi:hypothetical protein